MWSSSTSVWPRKMLASSASWSRLMSLPPDALGKMVWAAVKIQRSPRSAPPPRPWMPVRACQGKLPLFACLPPKIRWISATGWFGFPHTVERDKEIITSFVVLACLSPSYTTTVPQHLTFASLDECPCLSSLTTLSSLSSLHVVPTWH